MAQDKIIVRGAKEHNLKNVNVEIPRNKLVVFPTSITHSHQSPLCLFIILHKFFLLFPADQMIRHIRCKIRGKTKDTYTGCSSLPDPEWRCCNSKVRS